MKHLIILLCLFACQGPEVAKEETQVEKGTIIITTTITRKPIHTCAFSQGMNWS